MNVNPSVTIDSRDAAALLAEIQSRRPGYVPEWTPVATDPGAALANLAARFGQTIVQRLNQAPDKNKLAFLDMLGQQLAPARAASAPIVFQLASGVASGRAPAGTGVAAPPPPGSSQQIVFETVKEVGVSAGKLTQVFSYWPGRDEYIDHSADLLAGKSITLFGPEALTGVPHVLYLAHDTLLNLSGDIILSLEFQLTHPSSRPLDIAWEYWDGSIWRSFEQLDPSCDTQSDGTNDGTNGLTASGSILLEADCTKGSKTTVNGQSAYWIRGRLDQTLPPDPGKPLPEIESIRISSLVKKPLQGRLSAIFHQRARELARMFVAPAATQPLTMSGTIVNEAGELLPNATLTLSDPNNSGYGQRTVTTDDSGRFSLALDDFGTNHLMQFDVSFFAVAASAQFIVPKIGVAVRLSLKIVGLALDKAYNDGTKLDTTKPFTPFGLQPQPGTTFYFNNAETFAKPGARFQLQLPKTFAPSDLLQSTSSSIASLDKLVAWEYWNGREWASLSSNNTETILADFSRSEIVDFRVPLDMEIVAVYKDPDLWMRARLVSGGYGFIQTMTFNDNTFNVLTTQPPTLAGASIGYSWQFGPLFPQTVLAYNDFQYVDRTYESTWPGSSFLPYQSSVDITPAVYLGFDQQPPVADNGIFFDLLESTSGSLMPAMLWEYWDGDEWFDVSEQDETGDLASPGILSFLGEPDSALLPRFGTPLYWLRGRLKEDGPPNATTVSGIYPNAVWAVQQQTFNNVPLGTATGQPGEVFHVLQIPIIPGERLEVQELSGARANVEWRLTALELSGGDYTLVRQIEDLLGKEGASTDIVSGDLHLKRNKQKLVSEVWVRWYAQPTLLLSSPTDRHYAAARARGLLFFGNGTNGRALPQDAPVQLQRFQSGGGSASNVAAGTITQLLGAVSGVQGLTNVRAAEGGADGETLQAFRDRAPASVRHRGRALTAGDYEAMVREASAAVAIVKAAPNRNPVGRTLPGWLTLFIIPNSEAPRPWPSRGLRDEVVTYVARFAPAGLVASGHINVTGPAYFPVDVYATVVPRVESEAGSVETAASLALAAFLHPLTGGPTNKGWDFGRAVYLSDIARVLESVDGMDHAEAIQLVVDSQAQGEAALVPSDHIVVAGLIRLKVKGGVIEHVRPSA